MRDIQYIGEHLLPGEIGQFFLAFGFAALLLSMLAYTWSVKNSSDRLVNLGRWAFLIHGISMFVVIGTLFYVMANRYYEYQYVFGHVSDDLPMRYIFSAFWEGQEGSFLLWIFWNVVIGFLLIRTAKGWESRVLPILGVVQFLLISMIIGIYVPWFGEELKIGSNPFLLLRDTMDAPIFSNAEYLSLIQGQGLNELLQNYWMTIHPPTLFLGFASTAVPFCFSVAALWKRDHKTWLKPVLPWALFSAAILGIGILMGGAWAYEALSFGGYWAWDPVENMSLVPWLILIGGVHMNMVAKSTGHSIRMAHLFYALTFVMILYSSFLTRSGVLGDTSVHAFTEMGLEWQLIILMSGMALIWLIPFLAQFRSIPSPKKEEKTYSREFWMFIGSLVLLFSAVIITFTTSIPVYNKIVDAAGALFGQDYSSLHRTAPLDPIDHYNRYQIWVALLIAMLSGIAQLLRYRGVAWKNYAARFTRHLGLSAALGAGLFLLTYQVIKPAFWPYIALLFALSFGIMTNAVYLLRVIRGNLRLGTSALAHMGFAIMIIGSVASGLNKQIISSNPFAMAGLGQFSEKDLLENIILLRDEPMYMNGYDVTYVGDTLRGLTRTFFINFKRQGEDGDTREDFDLDPNVLYSKDFSEVRVSNPSTKHYLTRDIFTHITSLPPSEMGLTARQSIEDSLRFEEYTVSLRDTIYTSKSYGVLQHIKLHPTHPEYERDSNDITIGLVVDFYRLGTDEVWRAEPMICLRGNLVYNFADQIDDLGIRIQLTNQAFEQLFVEEVDLSYEALKFRRGDTHEYKGYEITFVDFDRDPSHPSYQPGPQDLAVGAHFRIVNAMDTFTVDPIYVIRNYQPYNLKDLVPDLGLVFRFTHIDPNTETVTLEVAEQNFDAIRVEIAEQVPRSDYLVLQAIVFPGIKLFWLGSVMMLLSIFLAMWHRIRRS